jgi:hypothetical protein
MSPARSPLNAVQAAIVAAVQGDASTMARLPGGVHDEVPENLQLDYLVVGDHLSVPDNDLTSFGREITVTLHIWTKARGFKRGQDILDKIVQLLDHRPESLTPTGHTVVSIRSIFDQAIRDPDPAWRHHILRFRINTAQED